MLVLPNVAGLVRLDDDDVDAGWDGEAKQRFWKVDVATDVLEGELCLIALHVDENDSQKLASLGRDLDLDVLEPFVTFRGYQVQHNAALSRLLLRRKEREAVGHPASADKKLERRAFAHSHGSSRMVADHDLFFHGEVEIAAAAVSDEELHFGGLILPPHAAGFFDDDAPAFLEGFPQKPSLVALGKIGLEAVERVVMCLDFL